MLRAMSGPVHIFTNGLWRLRSEIAAMSGLVPKRAWLSARGGGAVAGWGHKPTARFARALARRSNLPYLAFEDGFLRSLHPGNRQRPSAMIMDRSGIYYDARQPSDLETMLQEGEFAASEVVEAADLLRLISERRLSKYNHGRDGLREPPPGPLVLLIDQTRGDASIAGGLADHASFARMVEAACDENPGAFVAAKLHPEVIGGGKPGYLRELAARRNIHLYTENISPWAFLELRPKVYTVSSQFGFEAVLAGCEVVCFGVPFYAGWGLTADRAAVPRRTRVRTRHELAAAAYVRYSAYFDAWTRQPVSAVTAAGQLDFLRGNYLANSRPVIGYRIARWKRRAVSAMLDGPGGGPRFTGNLKRAIAAAGRSGGSVAAWGASAETIRGTCAAAAVPCMTIEDGFIRSAGLGAAFVQPLSLVFDESGIYYNATRPSDVETMLAQGLFSKAELARARELRERITAARITKYNLPETEPPAGLPDGRDIILAVGQVADDAAVRLGGMGALGQNVNATLLESARRRHPQAYVIFKPHPDVERVGRSGALTADQERRDADLIVRNVSLQPLFARVTGVETFSSLAGFEALLRGCRVTTHGMPFYAGWGLTEDLLATPRRGRARSLDELVAAALIRYARYWDPVSGLPCPAEIAIARIEQRRGRPPSPGGRLGLLAGRIVVLARRGWAHANSRT